MTSISDKWRAALAKKQEVQDLDQTHQELLEEARELRKKIYQIAMDLSEARQELFDMIQ